MNDMNDDELDRALFALPLEEAPENLRVSILAATIYRPALPVVPFKLWEVWALGGAAAVIIWACVLIAGGGANTLIATGSAAATTALVALAQPATLLWIALGCAVAFWLSQANFISLPVPQRTSRR